jgi:hypothetical protein
VTDDLDGRSETGRVSLARRSATGAARQEGLALIRRCSCLIEPLGGGCIEGSVGASVPSSSGVCDRIELCVEVVDVLHARSEPRIGRRALMGEREGGAAEVGER